VIKIATSIVATLLTVLVFNTFARDFEAKDECRFWFAWAHAAHEYMEAGLSREGWVLEWDDAAKKQKAEEILDALYSRSRPPTWLRECFGDKV
jgi:hypothetical protein